MSPTWDETRPQPYDPNGLRVSQLGQCDHPDCDKQATWQVGLALFCDDHERTAR